MLDMPHYRRPKLLLGSCGILLALSCATYLAIGESSITWALLLIAMPLGLEGAESKNSARSAALIYDRDSEEIQNLAYRPAGALLRCGYLLCVLLAIFLLGRADQNLLPDNFWAVVILVAPMIVYMIWARAAYRRSIAKVAAQEGWARRL